MLQYLCFTFVMVVFFILPYSVIVISRRTSIVFSLLFFFNNFVLIIWVYWVFAAARAFSSCGEQELLSGCNAQASHCSGFSWCRAQALGRAGFSSCSTQLSSCSSKALDHRVNSCGPWAELLCSMWDLPGSRIEPVFPAVAGRFFTTESPGQPSVF